MDAPLTAFHFWLDGGVVGDFGAGGAPSAGGASLEGGYGVTGSLGFGFGSDLSRGVGLLLQERELIANIDERHISSIGILVRWPADDGPWVALGGVHNHELPFSLYLEEPLEAVLAIHEDITHRTGVEAAVGWDFAPTAPDSPVASRWRPSVQLSLATLPGSDGPLLYGMLRATMRLGIR
jgi:hypothetical protein